MAVSIPDEFRDLIDGPVVVALVTVMPSGQPQATPVWWDFDGTYVRVNTARGRQKDKNMHVGARVTLLAIDPKDPYRWMEIRGKVVNENEAGAIDHINSLSAKYRGEPEYYKRNPQRRGKETRVIYRIEPLHVNARHS